VALDLAPERSDRWELLERRAQARERVAVGVEEKCLAMEDYLSAAKACLESVPPDRQRAVAFYGAAERLVKDLDPASLPTVRRAKGLLQVALGRHDEAAESLQAIDKPDWEVRRGLAQIHNARREFRKAAEQYHLAAADPAVPDEARAGLVSGQVSALRGQASVHRFAAEWDEAVAAYAAALRLEKSPPVRSTLHQERARTHEAAKRWKEALADYDAALALEKTPMQRGLLHQQRARVYEAEKRWKEALAAYDAAIELNPKYTWLYESKGRLLEGAGRWGDAVAEYEKALKINPRDSWIAQQVARASAEDEKWDRAHAALAEAIRLSPQDVNLLSRLAALQLWRRDEAGYRKTCATLVERFSKSTPAAANSVAWALVLGDERPAVELSQRAVKGASAYPTRTRANYTKTLAAAHYRAREYPQALERLKESIKLHEKDQVERKVPVENGNVDDWLLLALTHHALENPKEAREWLDRAAKWLDDRRKNRDFTDQSWTVWTRIEAEILLREAKRLIDPEKR
jgi:tetratricopeptide (TPR) repeat protein